MDLIDVDVKALNRALRGRCFYCGIQTFSRSKVPCRSQLKTKDHIVPKSKGGKSRVTCCAQCNNTKDDMSVEAYRQLYSAAKGLKIEETKFFGEFIIASGSVRKDGRKTIEGPSE